MESLMNPLPFVVIGIFLLINQERIVSSCPVECVCTLGAVVSCIRNSLDSLPGNLSSEVQFLDVSHNAFTSVPRDISQYKYIKKIIFAHNRINALGSNAFNGMNQLEYVDISWNTFVRASDLHRRALNATPSLKRLDLSGNALKTFPECESPTLEMLSLQNCAISALNPGVLHVFPNLKNLDLSHNAVPRLGGQFQSKSLVAFDLSDSQIKEVSNTALDKLKTLQRLHLARNYHLKSFGANSSSLTYLNLRDCNLESVPSSWLPNLTVLELSGNHIRRLEEGMFSSITNLENVSLGDNSMDYIAPGTFAQLGYLKVLDLSHNTIRSLDVKIFESNPTLELVNLSRNYIDVMTPFLSESLRTLDLTNCEISFLPWNLQAMTKLNELVLAGNLLNNIPVNLTSRSLTKLNLANNRLTSLKNHTFHLVPQMRHVNLVGNRLVSLAFYPSFSNIRVLYIGDNPWRCECESKLFENLFSILKSINSDVDIARCHSPSTLEGKTWLGACGAAWFPWAINNSNRTWVAGIALVTSFFASGCIFVAINRVYHRRRKRERAAHAQRQEEARDRLMVMIQAASQHVHEETRNAPDPRELQGPPSYNEAITMPPLGSTASLCSRKEIPLGSNPIIGSAISVNTSQLQAPSLNDTISNNNNVNNVKQKTRRKKIPKSPDKAYRRSPASHGSMSQLSDTNQSSSQLSSYVKSSSHTSEISQSNPDLVNKSGRPLSAKAKRRRRRSQTRSQNMEDTSSEDLSVIETNM